MASKLDAEGMARYVPGQALVGQDFTFVAYLRRFMVTFSVGLEAP